MNSEGWEVGRSMEGKKDYLCVRHYPNGIMTAHIVEKGPWEMPDATGSRLGEL